MEDHLLQFDGPLKMEPRRRSTSRPVMKLVLMSPKGLRSSEAQKNHGDLHTYRHHLGGVESCETVSECPVDRGINSIPAHSLAARPRIQADAPGYGRR